jgi:vacuolar-type H+-ATPase subunit C/Vma6
MSLSSVYTTGVIAVKEKSLLKDRLDRLAEMTVEEAFRALLEHGFGGGAETASSPYEYEALIAREERDLDAFILEYAPTSAAAAYFLSPRDFHNAKALFKARLLSVSAEKMLASEGQVPIAILSSCISSFDYSAISGELRLACEEAEKLLAEESVSGAELGLLFDKACYRHLRSVCKNNRTLRCFLVQKIDMINILTTVRAGVFDFAKQQYLSGGKLTEKTLEILAQGDGEKIKETFKNTQYAEFVRLCIDAREKNLPLSLAERLLGGYETDSFTARKYNLRKEEPFLYYVLRRKAENANVRIIFAGKLAGLGESEIKRRLRARSGGA